MPRQQINSIGGLIDALGGNAAVGKKFGLPPSTVGSWKERERIADDWRPALIAWAQKEGYAEVDYSWMAKVHVRKPRVVRLAAR